ncbi:MAG TPA: amidohydrolase family protein [Bryobacteraceae bacterium]|nr:amidohydrolase family protein [Bryobacteraceae bacterium]
MAGRSRWPLLVAGLMLAGCRRPLPSADPGILAEIEGIRAIDNHAHPVRPVEGGPPDREYDALPVENLEPESDPLNLRPGSPAVIEAERQLYGAERKDAIRKQKGGAYPAWVLDQLGIETMLANRVALGPGIEPPRFRWVAYADALIFPLDNSRLAEQNTDRKAFFALEDRLRARYLEESGLRAVPPTLSDYLARVVTPTLERQKRGGALAEKFEAAYLRSLAFDKADGAAAARIYAQYASKSAPPDDDYKVLQDHLFRYIAAECGRLGMAVHFHTMAGAGGYFDVAGANPLLLEPVLDDPDLRKTLFVMVHGGWPFTREITALLEKPNAYLDFSAQDLELTPATLAATLREWLEWVPEKVLFGTDAYPYSEQLGWEESGWMAARTGRRALAIALTGMMRDGEVSRERAGELARMVLRENARRLYGL